MIKCDCYPNHEICKNKNTCEFWIPLNQKLGRYTEIVAIDRRLKRVPKKNARGESILKPEDVQVGLNFNAISKEITDTETIIHELRIRENNILKILKKRANKY